MAGLASDVPDSIVSLASRLVATPSCGGIDSPTPVLGLMRDWFAAHRVPARLLADGAGKPAAVLAEIVGVEPGPVLCLDACIDTAPAGDAGQWSHGPFSGAVQAGRLQGRGAADSKAGVAILAHVARDIAASGLPRGTLHVLFDADEHTGRFGGVRAYLDALPQPPDAASLGYPGNECIVVGSRGFLRAKVHFAGRSEHSGAVERTGINALNKAAAFTLRVADAAFPDAQDPAFAFGPAATVTHLEGGEGFSVVPDSAICHVDIRLTRAFDGDMALRWLESLVAGEGRIELVDRWPAYLVASDAPLVQSFSAAAREAFGRVVPTDVCGPSNIGNLLAARGVPTICAPGVGFANIHAADEWADVASFAPVFRMYCDAARRFLG